MATTQPTAAPSAPHTTTILVAHGSRNPAARDSHEQLVRSLQAATGHGTRAAYLEMTEPSISSAIDAAVAHGATEIFVLPCLLHPGNHLLVDVPAVLDRSRQRHPEVRITMGQHLGALPGLVDLLATEVNRRGDATS